MAGERAGLAAGRDFTGDDLFRLLGDLRAADFRLGPREYIVAQEIAATCVDAGAVDGDRLKHWLAPALCASPREQADFYRVFDLFWASRFPPPDEVDEPRRHDPVVDEIVQESRPWKWAAALAGALLAVALGLAAWERLGGHPDETTAPLQTFDVSRPPVEVPDLQGLLVEAALAALADAGLAGEIVERVAANRPVGSVVAQAPAPASLAAKGAAVELSIAEGARAVNELAIKTRVVDRDERGIRGTSVALSIRFSHGSSAVNAAAFSPDGQWIVTASDDGTARVWSADGSGEPLVLAGHEDWVLSAEFSRDGGSIVTASRDGTARVWAVDGSGEPLLLVGHGGSVRCAKFSPDGQRIVTASDDGTARVWAADGSGEPLLLAWQGGSLLSAAFSPDGRRIVTASDNGTAWVWAADGSSEPLVLAGHEDWVLSARFSPDGQRIVTASGDGTARIWPVDGSREPLVLAEHGDSLLSAAFSPDGQRIVAASGDGTARVWSVDGSGEPLVLGGHEGWVWSAEFDPDGRRIVTASDDGTARAWTPTRTTPDGEALLARDQPGEGWQVAVHHPDYHPPEPYDLPREPGELRLKASLTRRGAGWIDFLERHSMEVAAGLGLLPLLIGGCWWGWRRSRYKLVLERRASGQALGKAETSLPEPRHDLFRGRDFARARVEARRRYGLGPGDLDADATVEATVSRLGFFSPVYRARLRLPVYLALVDRKAFKDQQARLVDELLDRLEQGGVAVNRYYFDGDPRLCAPRAGIQRSLLDLASVHADDRLLVFSDGRGLAHPVTGQLASWTERFARWRERALMTPVPAGHWTSREIELASSGFQVLPLSARGLLLFADARSAPDSLSALAPPERPPLPELFAERPGRWLERREPPGNLVAELCRQLRGYLGQDGFRWLCSLTVYPELEWHLTLYLGLRLKRDDGSPLLTERSLLDLARLPWLRHGSMPDWLRVRLVSELGEGDENEVRALLQDLLETTLESPDSDFRLEVARPREAKDRRAWARLFGDLLRTEPADSPLNDYVFVEFLRGRKPRRLQLLAPRNWHRWVYHRGLRALGLRPAAGLVGVALLSGLGFTTQPLIDGLRDWLPPETPSRISVESVDLREIMVPVPDVRGRRLADARALLEEQRFSLAVESDAAADSIVTDQSPGPGRHAATGSEVALAVEAPNGLLRIVNYPARGASYRLTIDGERWNGGNPTELRPGDHKISFDAGELGRETTAIEITSGKITTYSVPPRFLPWDAAVSAITPAAVVQGDTAELRLLGRGLGGTERIEFSGSGISQLGIVAENASARVRIQVASDAPPGPRRLTLTDGAGRSLAPEQITLEVRAYAAADRDPVGEVDESEVTPTGDQGLGPAAEPLCQTLEIEQDGTVLFDALDLDLSIGEIEETWVAALSLHLLEPNLPIAFKQTERIEENGSADFSLQGRDYRVTVRSATDHRSPFRKDTAKIEICRLDQPPEPSQD